MVRLEEESLILRVPEAQFAQLLEEVPELEEYVTARLRPQRVIDVWQLLPETDPNCHLRMDIGFDLSGNTLMHVGSKHNVSGEMGSPEHDEDPENVHAHMFRCTAG